MGACQSTNVEDNERYLLVCGSTGAGKSAILNKLMGLSIPDILSTTDTRKERITSKDMVYEVTEVGGGDNNKTLLKRHCENKDAIVFVVDTTNLDNFEVAYETLRSILHDKNVKDLPLLVYANKQDIACCLNKGEVIARLELHTLVRRLWHVEPCSANTGAGVKEGLEWLRLQLRSQPRKSTPAVNYHDSQPEVIQYIESPTSSPRTKRPSGKLIDETPD